MPQAETIYNVHCWDCDRVFQPPVKSPFWWQSKQREAKGFIDALHISGVECGCVRERVQREPGAPYRVFGYDDRCEDFDIPFYAFVPAVKKFRELNDGMTVVFINGVTEKMKRHLDLM